MWQSHVRINQKHGIVELLSRAGLIHYVDESDIHVIYEEGVSPTFNESPVIQHRTKTCSGVISTLTQHCKTWESHDVTWQSHNVTWVTWCHMAVTRCHMAVTWCHMAVTQCHMAVTRCHMAVTGACKLHKHTLRLWLVQGPFTGVPDCDLAFSYSVPGPKCL